MKRHEQLDDRLITWISQQNLFFVASAPLASSGHVNLSPRGYDSFRVLDNHTVAWLDLTGSGNETSAHIQENGRLTVMFCAFEGEPLILRLYGQGEVILPHTESWQQLLPRFTPLPGARQIIRLRLERIQTSCGFGVPLMQTVEDRPRLMDWATKKGPQGLHSYREKNNQTSIDGLKVEIEQAE